MRRRIFLMVMVMIAASMHAQEKERHDNAVTFGAFGGGDLSVRHIFRDRWCVLGRVGYGTLGDIVVSPSPNVSSDAYELGLAVRRTFGVKPFRPFVHLEAIRNWYDFGCTHTASMDYLGGGGVEYFVAPRVSVEGLGGIEHNTLNSRCQDNTYRAHQTLTFRSGVFVSSYF